MDKQYEWIHDLTLEEWEFLAEKIWEGMTMTDQECLESDEYK